MSTLEPRRSAISRPIGSMACSAVVALMLALPMVTLASAFMRVVKSNMDFMCAFLSNEPNMVSQASATGVPGSVMYGPMPERGEREGREISAWLNEGRGGEGKRLNVRREGHGDRHPKSLLGHQAK